MVDEATTTGDGSGAEVHTRRPPRALADGRFRLEQRLGEGGMGVVHLAYDAESEQWVALKLLRRIDSQAIYRFKREFRALADIRHDHLVRLYELLDDQGEWFLTMEHLEGSELLDDLHAVRTSMLDLDLSGPGPDGLSPTPVFEMTRLRTIFLQVAEGICALHQAGRLHRDLKPHNVIVTHEGRAVVLDFGIAAVIEPHGALDTIVDRVVGTPAYMAPEQASGAPPDEASDWYAFGVMLYEALSGDLPFDDANVLTLVSRKQDEDPPALSTLVSGVPTDLDALTMALLARDPEARPAGHQVVAALRRSLGRSAPPPPIERAHSAFAGRAGELAALRDALSRVREGAPVLARVVGPSGMGKTTLAEHFLRHHVSGDDTVVLAGRCYEHESVGFKAFDSIIDALSRHLSSLARAETARLLPRRVVALTSVFPVLGRVHGMTAARRRDRSTLPAEVGGIRRTAFDALRELLSRIAADKRLVLYIDDLQWGDVDSIELLEAVTRGPGAPAMLLLCTYRSEDVRRSPCLRALEEYRRRVPDLAVRDVDVGPMPLDEVRELTERLETEPGVADPTLVARESGGSPFLIRELLTYLHERGGGGLAGTGVSLDEVIAERIARLSTDARELLSLLAVAARPLPRSIYRLVRGLGVDLSRATLELRGERMLRSLGRTELSVYHDRIREVAVARMAQAERAMWHRRLATALEAAPEVDHDMLAHHWFEAYEAERAVPHALRAAERAIDEFAFGRAAALYQRVLDRGAPDRPARALLLGTLAEVLVLAGRRSDAASTWLWAAAETDDEERAADLRVRAGRALVLAGHTSRGLELLEEGLRAHGLTIPAEPAEALSSWLHAYARLRERGLEPGPEFGGELPEARAQRLDLLWAVGLGLFRVIGVRSWHFVITHLVEALDHGDHYRAVRGLCMHYAFVDLSTALSSRTEPLGGLDVAERLAAEVDDPRCNAWLLMARGAERWQYGDDAALGLLEAAHSLFEEACPGSTPERSVLSAMITHELTWTHRWAEIAERAESWQADAASRDDQAMLWIKRLAGLLTEVVRGELERADASWNRVRAEAQHVRPDVRFPLEVGRSVLSVLRGDESELRRFIELSDQYLRGPEGGLPRWRVPALIRRAACHLRLAMDAADEPSTTALLDAAEQDLDRAQRRELPRFEPAVFATRAGLARLRGATDEARENLDAAIDACAAGSTCQRALYRYARASVTGDEAERAEALAALRDGGVEDPRPTLDGFYPGVLE